MFLLRLASLREIAMMSKPRWTKTFKTRRVHFFFSLVILLFAKVIITSIKALGMFTNPCLVLLLLLASPLSKKAKGEFGKWSDIVQIGR